MRPSESIVLLKNEAIFCRFRPPPSGSHWRLCPKPPVPRRWLQYGEPHALDNALDCLRACPELEVVGFQPGFLRGGGTSEEMAADAVELAGRAEAVLLFLGLPEAAEAEGMDRPRMALPENQLELFERGRRRQLQCVGDPVRRLRRRAALRRPLQGHRNRLLGRTSGGGRMADVLTGSVNPSGKLAESWPLTYSDTPACHFFPGTERTAEYREGPLHRLPLL